MGSNRHQSGRTRSSAVQFSSLPVLRCLVAAPARKQLLPILRWPEMCSKERSKTVGMIGQFGKRICSSEMIARVKSRCQTMLKKRIKLKRRCLKRCRSCLSNGRVLQKRLVKHLPYLADSWIALKRTQERGDQKVYLMINVYTGAEQGG